MRKLFPRRYNTRTTTQLHNITQHKRVASYLKRNNVVRELRAALRVVLRVALRVARCVLSENVTNYKLGILILCSISLMTKMDTIPYGTVVWGKLQGFQEWPSRVNLSLCSLSLSLSLVLTKKFNIKYAHPNETSQKVRDMKTDDEELLIFFFGTHN
jgi:hypothetical protein